MNINDFSVAASGSTEPMSLSNFEGQVLLIVNTASKCGFTPQFAGLEELYQEYRDSGFSVVGFPCNQFAGQDPGTDAEIAEFCQVNYGVNFPMMSKIDVNGSTTEPLYVWLKSEAPGLLGSEGIKWNFTKFLVGRDGAVIKRFGSKEEPKTLRKDIEAALDA